MTRAEVPEFSAQLLKCGWKFLWAPSVVTQAGGKSGGALICARKHLDFGKAQLADVPPENWPIELWPGRALAGRAGA